MQLATSAASPKRPQGIDPKCPSGIASRMCSISGVRIVPGATAFTRIRRGALAQAGQLRDRAAELLAAVGHRDDARALTEKPLGGGLADAAARARDDRRFSREPRHVASEAVNPMVV